MVSLFNIFHRKKIRKIPLIFWHLNDFECQNFAIFPVVFIILVSRMISWYSEKMLISNRCMCGFMPNSHKKSWKISNFPPTTQSYAMSFQGQNILFWYKNYLFSTEFCFFTHSPSFGWFCILKPNFLQKKTFLVV